ncbi:hypothetical protein SteCoe_3390 [Stentor coeruleus]|uniref:Ion transport domain-containing protein n=1 Tax=Stentor coeruleus TaxID=5963 RepID=A0A1R2CX20_9CILI|nr:hypothetical protein SteCoe_3390 [Stentor coeruleus]
MDTISCLDEPLLKDLKISSDVELKDLSKVNHHMPTELKKCFNREHHDIKYTQDLINSVESLENLDSYITYYSSFREINTFDFHPDLIHFIYSGYEKSIKICSLMPNFEPIKLNGHNDEVLRVCFSLDGELIASSSIDKTVIIWSFTNRCLLHTFKEHSCSVYDLKFTNDKEYLIGTSRDTNVRVWNISQKKLEFKLEGHKHYVYGIDISYDNRKIATCSYDENIIVWNLQEKKESFRLKGHNSPVNCVKFNKNAEILISCCNKLIKIWDLNEKCEIKSIIAHTDCINSLNFSRDFDMFVSASNDKSVKIYKTSDFSLVKHLTCFYNNVVDAKFSPDGRFLFCASSCHAKIFNFREDRKLKLQIKNAHSKTIISIAFTDDDKKIITCSKDKTIKFWNVEDGNLDFTLTSTEDIYKFAINPKEKYIATSNESISIWDLTEKVITRSFCKTKDPIKDIKFSPNGNILASGLADNSIKLWSWTEGIEIFSIIAHRFKINTLCFSPDSTQLISGYELGDIKFWNLESKSLACEFSYGTDSIMIIDISPNGKSIIRVNKSDITIWNTESNKDHSRLGSHSDTINSCKFNYDGQFIASASKDYSLKVYNTSIKKEKLTLFGEMKEFSCLDFSKTKNFIAASQLDGDIMIWDIEETNDLCFNWYIGKSLSVKVVDNQILIHYKDEDYILTGHKSAIVNIKVNNNERYLATVAYDNVLKCWDLEKRSVVLTIENFYPHIFRFFFNANNELEIVDKKTLKSQIFTCEIAEYSCKFKTNKTLFNEKINIFNEIDGLEVYKTVMKFVGNNDFSSINDWNARISNNGYTPMHFAAFANDVDIISKLLDNHIQLKADIHGRTPLFYALFHENKNMAEMILLYIKQEIENSPSETQRVSIFQDLIYDLSYFSTFSPVAKELLEQGLNLSLKYPNDLILSASGIGRSPIYYSLLLDLPHLTNIYIDYMIKLAEINPDQACDAYESLNKDFSFIIEKMPNRTEELLDKWIILSIKNPEKLYITTDNIGTPFYYASKNNHNNIAEKYIGYYADFLEQNILSTSQQEMIFKIIIKEFILICQVSLINIIRFITQFKTLASRFPYLFLQNQDFIEFKAFYNLIDNKNEEAASEYLQMILLVLDNLVVWKKHKLLADLQSNIPKIIETHVKSVPLLLEYYFSFSIENPHRLLLDNNNYGKSIFYYSILNCEQEFIDQVFKYYITILSNENIQPESIIKFLQPVCYDLGIIISNSSLNLFEFLKSWVSTALKYPKDIQMKKDSNGNSPIYTSVINKKQVITDLLIKYLISIGEIKNISQETIAQCYTAISRDLLLIINNSSSFLKDFLTKSMYVKNTKPIYGKALIQSQFYSESSNLDIQSTIISDDPENQEPLKIMISFFTVPSNPGSKLSLEFLTCLLESNTSNIFRFQFVRTYLTCKWTQLWFIIITYTAFIWINLLIISLILSNIVDEYNILPIFLICINALLFIWELCQIIAAKLSYFKSLINLIDITRFSLTSIWIYFLYDKTNYKTLTWFMLFFNILRGVTGFRAFSTTRYYIRLIIESLRDILSFLFIFAYTTVSFGLLGLASDSSLIGNFSNIWINPFKITIGGEASFTSNSFDFNYATFLIAIVVNFLLMLNLIISILGDSFDKFQIESVDNDAKEMFEVIIEIEQVLYLFGPMEKENHLLMVENYYGENDDGWQGKMINMQVSMDKISSEINKKFENFENRFDKLENSIQEKLDFLISKYK